tara:strand:+ start:1199 stop:1657 length:459 start_codon:yes stop_codon:yes gene_type:complete
MYITTNIDEFKINNIFLHEPVKNIMKTGCEFMKIMYSNSIYVMNGVYLDIILNKVEIQKRKEMYKIRIDKVQNKDLLTMISKIELEILDLLPSDLCRVYSLDNEYDKSRQLKNYSELDIQPGLYNNLTCTLRIFGVWKDAVKCGLNYQYMIV